MSKNSCYALRDAGTAVWLDQLSRELIEGGKLRNLMDEAALTGVTSNPAIFHKAMTEGVAYDRQMAELKGERLATEALYEHLAVRDIQMACDALRPAWESTGGRDGYVSFEVSPHLARKTAESAAAAKRLHDWVSRPNLLIKIPGTPEGIPAIEEALFQGIAVNVTLLFSVEAYEAVARAYISALRRRAAGGRSLRIASVASFFVSRIDSLIDARLEKEAESARSAQAREEMLDLRGKLAVANAKTAYQSYLRIFEGPEFQDLAARGAWPQRPLWASTSTKNPVYRDVLYVEPLVGRNTVNTMPLATIEAVLDHGVIVPDTVESGVEEAQSQMERLERFGISFRQATDQLLDEAIAKFNDPYDKLLAALQSKRS